MEYLCVKQLDYNKRFHHNLVNTFSVYTMDYPGGSIKTYSARELLKYRSMPRQWILPDQQLLARLKVLGILNFRSYRSGTKTSKSNKPQRKQRSVTISNLVYQKRKNDLSNFRKNVTCLTLNCHSVDNKDVLVGQLLREDNIDFALLTETWYSDDKQSHFETSDLNPKWL